MKMKTKSARVGRSTGGREKSKFLSLFVVLLLATVLQVETAQANPEVTEAEQFLYRANVTLFQDDCRPDRPLGLEGLTPASQNCGGLGSDWFAYDCTGVFTVWAPLWIEFTHEFISTAAWQEIGINAMNVFGGAGLLPSYAGFEVDVYIDGNLVGGSSPSMLIPASDTEVFSSSVVTDMLMTGPHTIRIVWLNDDNIQDSEGHFHDPNIMIKSVFINGAIAPFASGILVCDHPPVATDDFYGMNQASSFSVLAPGVLANDSDPDEDLLTVELVSGPANAASFQLNPNGSFTYTPPAYFYGEDSFTYRVNDGTADSEIATVHITVSQPGSQGFITGGGKIFEDGRKCTFGFVAKVQGNGVQGNLEFQDHDMGLDVKAGTMDWVYAPNQIDGSFSGACRVNGVGGHTFFVQIHDRGQPGSNDDFTIWMFDSFNNPVYSAGALLSGGNIVIHGH
jgi:hypothetical protein